MTSGSGWGTAAAAANMGSDLASAFVVDLIPWTIGERPSLSNRVLHFYSMRKRSDGRSAIWELLYMVRLWREEADGWRGGRSWSLGMEILREAGLKMSDVMEEV